MAKLIAKSPCAWLLPKTIGAVDLTEVEPSHITLIAPHKGQKKAVSDALKAAVGLTFPAPNRVTGAGARAVWCGIEQALLMGVPCPDLAGAACVDQKRCVVRPDRFGIAQVVCDVVNPRHPCAAVKIAEVVVKGGGSVFHTRYSFFV